MFIIGLFQFLFVLLGVSHASQLHNLQNALGITDINNPILNISSSPDNSLQVFGNFKDLTFYRYTGQQNFSQEISSSSDSHGLVYYSNDTFIQLIQGSNDTHIKMITPFGSDSFILSGTGSLSGYKLENQLLYNLSNLSIIPIFEESLKNINSILVDGTLAYFGGNFSLFNANGSFEGHSAAFWNYTTNSTSLLPFVGFGENSTINSIVKLDDDNILFAGSFSSLDDPSLLQTVVQNMSLSSNVTQIELGQLISLQYATWKYQGSSFNESTFVCQESDTESWFQEGTSGTLECALPYQVLPNKVRIYNSPNENNEISLFRITTTPSDSIMNLTYVDPLSGELGFCDAFCPLFNRERLEQASANVSSNATQIIYVDNNHTDIKWSAEYQEFAFVNDIEVSGLQFMALNSYGDNVGLSSFQIFQDTISIFANNSLNEAGCSSAATSSYSSISDNIWTKGLASNSYISTHYLESSEDIPKVTFYVNIDYAGDYTINIYTAGCLADGTCSSRSVVNVTLWNQGNNSRITSSLIYQNNEDIKYDQIFSGHLESSCMITLEYDKSIYPNNPSAIVVADYVEVLIDSIDSLNTNTKSLSDIPLNGLFQYKKSNFTNEKSNSTGLVGNTTLNQYAVQNFPSNASLHASMYNNTLWLGGSVSGVAQIDLNDGLDISSANKIATGGKVEGIASYSEGLIMFGAFNLSSQTVSTLTYNGSFNSYGDLGTIVESFVNVTLKDSELLIFDNAFIFNLSSQSYIYNTSAFALSIWSAGQNSQGDLIFSGSISEKQYTGLNGSAFIFDNSSCMGLSSINDMEPYMAVYLNETLNAHAYSNNSATQLIFSDGSVGPWQWFDVISSMVYSSNGTILAVGSYGSSGDRAASQLSILNLTSLAIIANETMDEGSQVNSMILFERNSTVLVGGNFSVPHVNCCGLCLYNYEEKEWSTFANGSIAGTVNQLQIHDVEELIISGLFNTKTASSVSMASVNLSNFTISPILWGTGAVFESFIVNGNDILTWNSTNLLRYDEQGWNNLQLPNITSYNSITSIQEISTNEQLNTTDESGTQADTVLISGQFYDTELGNMQTLLYDLYNQQWSPYYMTSAENSTRAPQMTFFANRDVSSLYNSQLLLLNVNATTSSNTSNPPTPSLPSGENKQRKVHRGFVVLIGLALAIGTVALIGIIGVLVAYIFKDSNGYEPINPRTDEKEMIDTVPPEKLLKFL